MHRHSQGATHLPLLVLQLVLGAAGVVQVQQMQVALGVVQEVQQQG